MLLRAQTQDLQLEAELLLVRIQDLQLVAVQFLAQIQDQPHVVERPRGQIHVRPRDLHEIIRQHGHQIVLRALVQPQDQLDLRHVRALLLQQGQVQQEEVAAVVVAALQEGEIIRHK